MSESVDREQWRRLSPRMLIIHPVIEVVRASPALLGLLLAGSHNRTGSLWTLGLLAIVVSIALSRWFTTRYRIGTDQVQLRHGLLRRRTQAAPLDRVRTVDVSSHLLHRMLGLAKVSIGTGTSDKRGRGGLVLDGLDATVASRLRGELLHGKARVVPAGVAPGSERVLLRFEGGWIRFAPFTLSGVVTGLALAGFLWRVESEARINLDKFGPSHRLAEQLRRVPPWAIALETLAAVLVFVVLASVVGYVLAFWGFRLSQHEGGTLHVARGLITTRAISIEARRLRGVELSEPLLLRAVGGARCLAVATGLRVGRGSERGGSLLVPPAPRAVSLQVGSLVLGSDRPITVALIPHGPTARTRRYVRAFAALAFVAALGTLSLLLAGAGRQSWWPWTLVLLALPLAADRYRSLGHARVDGYLVTRFGSLVRRRCAVAEAGIVGWTVRRTYFQRRSGVATLVAATAAGRQRYRVQDLAEDASILLAAACCPGLLDQFAAQPPA